MFKLAYKRSKVYLNTYATLGTFTLMLVFLLLPTFTFKESASFFYNIRFSYQYSLLNLLIFGLYFFNVWNYMKKNIILKYQAHRYGSSKFIFKNCIFDVIFIIIVLELSYFILSVACSLIFNDGFYLSIYKFYGVTNLCYLIYLLTIRLIIYSLSGVLLFYAFYLNNNLYKFLIFVFLIYNFLFTFNNLPISFNSILSGCLFSSFINEILIVFIILFLYFILIIFLGKILVGKKID